MMKSIICKLQSKVLEKVSMIREDNRGIGTVGVPQKRERVFFIARKKELMLPNI